MFKIGDKVQVVNCVKSEGCDVKVGTLGVVEAIRADEVVVHIKSRDMLFYCYTKDLILDPGNDEEQLVAIKHDDHKVRLELLSPIALNEIGKVLTQGAKKYQDHNWRQGFKWSRLLGAALRHLMAFMGGQDKDPETGLSHLAHLGCCVMFLLEHEITHKALDDRHKIINNE